MNEITGSLSENEETLTLSLSQAPGCALPMSADEVDQLIGALMSQRAKMKPPVPLTMPVGGPYRGILDPSMVVETEGMGEHILIHLRHPGAGWLHFGFSTSLARALGRHLVEKADAVEASRAKIPDRKN